VKEWQRNAIRHLIAQRDTLDNDIWQMNNRRNNLAEMEQEAQKKLSELELSGISTRTLEDTEKSLFIEFEITLNKTKIEDLRRRLEQKDASIQSMEQARNQVKRCLTSYSKGENPRLPVMRYIRGLFFYLS
jgi:predicted RNase H-like nuclease (RuvC/YqgF family)